MRRERAYPTLHFSRLQIPITAATSPPYRTFFQLPVETPATPLQLNISTKQIALPGGVLGNVNSHTIRRRALRDKAYLKKTMNGVTNAAVTAIAYYSNLFTHRGVTWDFVKGLQDLYSNLHAKLSHVDSLAPKITVIFIHLPLKQLLLKINFYINKHNINTLDSNQRKARGKIL